MYIDMKDENFSHFINQLPSLLKDDWSICDDKQFSKNPDSEESFLVCEYAGYKFDKVLMFIDLEGPDEEGHTHFQFVTQHKISDQKELVSLIKDFENMLKQQGCRIEVGLEEYAVGKFIPNIITCDKCGRRRYSYRFHLNCPCCGDPLFTLTKSEAKPSVVPCSTVDAMYEREKETLECLLGLDIKERCDFIQESLRELARTCRCLYPGADRELEIKFLCRISMWAMKCDGDLNDYEIKFLESFLESNDITTGYSTWHFTGYSASKAKEELSTSVSSAKFNTFINHIDPEINYFPFMEAILTIFGIFATSDKKIYNETAQAFYELKNLFQS